MHDNNKKGAPSSPQGKAEPKNAAPGKAGKTAAQKMKSAGRQTVSGAKKSGAKPAKQASRAPKAPPKPAAGAPGFSADAPEISAGAAKLISRNSAAAEKARQKTQSAAQQPAAAQTRAAAQPPAPARRFFGRAERVFDEAFETDRKMAGILAAMSRQFAPGQIFAMPFRRALPFLLLGWLCMLIQTLSMNAFTADIPEIGAYFHTSTTETLWLISAYMAPYASFTILLVKLRTQFGLRVFTVTALFCFLICSTVGLMAHDYNTALVTRFFAGLTTAPISSIGFLYTFEAFTPMRKVTIGISLNMLYSALGTPVARIVGAGLLTGGHVPYFYIFEIGLTCIALALIYYIHITPLPRVKVLQKMDFISYPLMAAGLGLTAAMMPVGRYYWWQDAEWMGWAFAFCLLCLFLALLIELNRKTPLIDFRWLFSWDMLHITLVMLSFRILISDQSSLLGSYFAMFGLQNENLVCLYIWTALGTILGGVICVVTLRPGGGDYLYLIGALIIACGSFSDSFSTGLTRPQDMFVSQMLIGCGTALFMAVSMGKGMTAAFARASPTAVVTFIAAFLFTQSTGGIIGSAFFGTLQEMLEKFHSYILTGHLVMSDPAVAARAAANGSLYAGVLTDGSLLRAEGLSLLEKQTALEANILAYNDIFRIYGYIAVALFCILGARLLIVTRYFVSRVKAAQVKTAGLAQNSEAA